MTAAHIDIAIAAQMRRERRRGRGDTQFPGITRHARQLGVNRATLWRALKGEWSLKGLVTRYQALLDAEQPIRRIRPIRPIR